MLKKITLKVLKKSFFIGGWSTISIVLLIHFFYYGVFPSSET
jgi:hypothetical protein